MGMLHDFFWYPRVNSPLDMLERTYEGIDEAVEYLRKCCAEHGPIDGIWGFSQGANAANILIAEALAGGVPELSDVRFVIHANGSRPGWVQQRPHLFRKKLQIPALITGGGAIDLDTDGQMRWWWSMGDLYEAPQFLMHEDGHTPFPRS